MQSTLIKARRQRGFTLIEMLVVAPMVILLIGAVIAYITTLTGQSLQVQQKESMTYDVQNALDTVEGDAVKATRFLSNSGPLTPPQGKNDDGTAFASTDPSLIMGTIATDVNPLSSTRHLIVYANQPDPCGTNPNNYPITNTTLIIKTIYFVKGNSLWKRTIVPTYNTNSTPDDFTVCKAPWQRNSCSPGYTNTTQCKAEDEEILQNVTNFSVTYYADPSGTTALAATNAPQARTVDISLTAQQIVAGKTITQTDSIRVTRQNNVDSDLVMPATAPTPSCSADYTISVTCNWNTIPNATSYVVSYGINGACNSSNAITRLDTSFTVAPVNRTDNVTFCVAARNSYGKTANGQTTVSVPSTVPCDLQNGWGNYGSVYGSATFTKTSAGAVVLSGLIKKATTPSQYEVICNLPPGYRPSAKLIFAPFTSGTTQARIDVDTNGDVTYVFGNQGFISLDGINFLEGNTPNITWKNLSGSAGWTAYGSVYAPPQYATDSLGRTFVQGLGKGGTTTANTIAFSGFPAPSGGSDIYPAFDGTYSSLQTNVAGTIGVRYSTSNGYWSTQFISYPAAAGTWNAMTTGGGWVTYGSVYTTPQYMKSADGLVTLRGLIKSGTTTNGTVIYILPSAYWPPYNVICSVMSYNASTNEAPARIDVATNGQIIVREGVGVNWLSLSGCSYMTSS